MNVEIGAEAVLLPEKEYIYGIFVAVCITLSNIVPEWLRPGKGKTYSRAAQKVVHFSAVLE